MICSIHGRSKCFSALLKLVLSELISNLLLLISKLSRKVVCLFVCHNAS